MAKEPKPKQVKFDLINSNDNAEPYNVMRSVRKEFHKDTLNAEIALAWQLDIKPDVDGHVLLGKCIKASDLQRELVDYDFVILLNKAVWQSSEFTIEKKRALMDHELMHADIAVDKEGEPKINSKGRSVWRIRAHDIQEFHDVVRRHGCYKGDLEKFAEIILKRNSPTLFDKKPGDVQVVQ